MSTCPKCGKEVAEGSVFCPYCGSKLLTEKEEKTRSLRKIVEKKEHYEEGTETADLLEVVVILSMIWGLIIVVIGAVGMEEASVKWFLIFLGAFLIILGVILAVWNEYQNAKSRK